MSSAMPLLLLEWFILSSETALHFRGTFMPGVIAKCHSSVNTGSPPSTKNVLNLLAIYAINYGALNL
jgi:hypothetical protein